MASSSSNSSSWMPPKGRYPVNIGTSLGRAIKQRKSKGSPAATAKKSNLPEREFYSFKFGFKASSIDTTRPATIEIKKGSTETNQVTAEYPSTQPGEVHIFTGQEQKAKEVDCVLIFDEETGVFTLEKIDSSLHLKFDRKQAVSHEGSPVAAATPASTSSSKGKAKQEDYDDDRRTNVYDEDVKREVDVFEDILPSKRAVKQEEEEDEDEELPLRQVVTHKAQPTRPPPKAVPPSTKPAPKARPEPKAPPPAASPPPPARSKAPPAQSQPQPKSQPRPPPPSAPPPQAKVPLPSPQSKPKPPPPPPAAASAPRTAKRKVPVPGPGAPEPKPSASASNEEIIEFGKPAKRARPSLPSTSSKPAPVPPPPPPAPASPLSLPGTTASFALPPAPVSSNRPSASRAPPPPSAPSPVLVPQQVDSDEDEEWEAVAVSNPPTVSQPKAGEDQDFLELALEEEIEDEIFGDGFADDDGDMEMVEVDPAYEQENEQEDINQDLFEAQLDAELREESMDPMDPEPDDGEEDFLAGAISPVMEPARQPVSLSRFAAANGTEGGIFSEEEEFSSSDESD